MAKRRAYVYRETAGIDEFRVYPPVIVLEKSDDFELVNVSGDVAKLKIRAGAFDGGAVDQDIPDKKGATKKVLANAEAQAVEYAVFVNGKRAKANSDPVIIIDL